VNPFIELMQAGAFIMLLFAAVLIMVVLRNVERATLKHRAGPAVIGLALVNFAIPVYAAVIGGSTFEAFTPIFRVTAAILLPVGLYLLAPLRDEWSAAAEADERAAPTPSEGT
jgi:hypothetical protein